MYRYRTQTWLAEVSEYSGEPTFRLPFAEAFTPHERVIVVSEILLEVVAMAAVLNRARRVQI